MAVILYPTSETSIDVGTFADTIRKNSRDYNKFQVLRITHVKDLANWVWHEFLQVIVLDTATKNLLRILVERQPENDTVVVRRWAPWKEGATPPSGGTNYPLALYTVYFDRPVPLSRFSALLKEVHNSKPNYTATQANCFWYALTVYTTSYGRFYGRQKKWAFSLYRGTPAPLAWLWWWSMVLPVRIFKLSYLPLLIIVRSILLRRRFRSDDMMSRDVRNRSALPHRSSH